MDLQSLSSLFATTYNPDPNVRKAAELQIRKVGFTALDLCICEQQKGAVQEERKPYVVRERRSSSRV